MLFNISEVDTCLTSPCENDGTCTKTGPGTFVCDCPYPWNGPTCTQCTCHTKIYRVTLKIILNAWAFIINNSFSIEEDWHLLEATLLGNIQAFIYI